jgi:hypothetical protein
MNRGIRHDEFVETRLDPRCAFAPERRFALRVRKRHQHHGEVQPGRGAELYLRRRRFRSPIVRRRRAVHALFLHAAPQGGAGGGGGGGPGGSDAGNDAQALANGMLLSSGSSRLVDVFVGDAGIFVVAADSVIVVDRAGTVLHMLAAPREVTAAAFDGTTLAVADKAFLKVYTIDLTEVASPALTEACVSLAIASGNRVLCAGASTFPSKFYAFDATKGTPLMTSSVSSGSSVPLRRVPGKDDLVTLDSSVFRLLRVDAASLVTVVGASPFNHMYRASTVFGFVGNPADHLITEDAILANIYDALCAPSSTTTAQCFVQDGALGTLRGMERFIGLEGSDGSGKAHALVATTSSSFGSAVCRAGCSAQSIDVVGRVVESSKPYSLDLGQSVAVRHDAKADALVVGFARPTGAASPSPGYRVELLSYR